MHAEISSSARVRLERLVHPVRSTHFAKQTRHTLRRITTAHMARSHEQPSQQKTANYLRINLKPRPEWMYDKNARSSSQMFPATLSRASSSKRPRAIESSPA